MLKKTLMLGVIVFLTAQAIGPEWYQGNAPLRLEVPLFVLQANAQQSSGANFLQKEAGIAAYVKVDQEIDISELRGSFSVVEQLDDDYLTGQIPVSNLDENWTPRVFVSRDGWIVAYYPKQEPASIMLALWIRQNLTGLSGTTLEFTIREVLSRAGLNPSVVLQGMQYFHFQYSTADTVMVVRENIDAGNEDSFFVTIPNGLLVSEASWVMWGGNGGYSQLYLDSQQIHAGGGVSFGAYLPQLATGLRHQFTIRYGAVGILLLYSAAR